MVEYVLLSFMAAFYLTFLVTDKDEYWEVKVGMFVFILVLASVVYFIIFKCFNLF